MRPRIAVNCDVEDRGRERCFLYTDYLDAILDAGGDPLLLPPDRRALPLLDEAHGVLLTGGDDYAATVDPSTPPVDYIAIHPRREEIDFAVGRVILDRDLPVLAICAGFQLLVHLEGGEIIGDIPTEIGGETLHRRASPEDDRPHHPVRWLSEGPPGVEETIPHVVSHHHQGVGAVPERWRTWAVADDGVIEAAVGPGRWQVGVQWHPELAPRGAAASSLFRGLIDAARGEP